MTMTFEGVWAEFRHRLKPRTTITNWSIKGYTGGEFRIDIKHITSTMDAEDPDTRFELRDNWGL